MTAVGAPEPGQPVGHRRTRVDHRVCGCFPLLQLDASLGAGRPDTVAAPPRTGPEWISTQPDEVPVPQRRELPHRLAGSAFVVGRNGVDARQAGILLQQNDRCL